VSTRSAIHPLGEERNVADPGSVELTAVVAALAGVRRGDTFAVLGSAPLLVAALSAAAGHDGPALGPVDVAVALAAYDVPAAVVLLGGGGRLVALAADRAAAERTAHRHGLTLRHLASVPGRVAWSAVLSESAVSLRP
jgi:hypothetical protein